MSDVERLVVDSVGRLAVVVEEGPQVRLRVLERTEGEEVIPESEWIGDYDDYRCGWRTSERS